MTASESRKKLPKFIDNNTVADDYVEYEDVIDTVCDALDLLEKQENGLIIELPVPIGTYCYKIYLDTEYDKYLGTSGEWRFGEYLFEADDIEEYLEHKDNFVATKEEAEARLAEVRGEK